METVRGGVLRTAGQGDRDGTIESLIKDLQIRFSMLMLQLPNTAELEDWHDRHPNIICDLCLRHQPSECIPKANLEGSPDYSSCAFCATTQSTLCSWRLHEVRYRVKKILNIDDQTFNVLELQTRQIRSWYLSQIGVSTGHAQIAGPSTAAPQTTSATTTQTPPMPSLPISTDNLEEREPRNLKDLLADAASKIDDLETKVKESDMSRLIAEEKARNAETRVKGLESLLKERDAANGDISDLVNQVNELKETLSNVKLKKDILSQRVTALEDLHAASVQKELIEHANIHVLIRLLSHAREDFSRGQLTQEEMLQTCDNLGDQLKEVAARRLEMAPVGFLPIQRAMRMRTRRNWDTAFSNETEYDEKSSKTTLDTENNDLECSSKRPRT